MLDRLDLLTSLSGVPITNTMEWEQFRRPELMILLEDFVYGVRPHEKPDSLRFVEKCCKHNYLGLSLTFKEVEIFVNGIPFSVYLFLPQNPVEPVPAFVFCENEYYMRQCDIREAPDQEFLPIPEIVARGYAVAVMPLYYVSPDWNHYSNYSGFKQGVFAAMQPNTTHRTHRSWATISGWAFGASRVLDYLEQNPEIDSNKVAVAGHSRAGKAALWAGATDMRFKLIIANSTGCAGAAYTRGKKGEHIKDINISDWFCQNYHKYSDHEEMLPVDQHMLLATIAPRPLYIKSDVEDEWSDPDAELKSALLASPVYELYGMKGVVIDDEDIILSKKYHDGMIAYHRAPGDHDMTRFDWRCYLDFADKHLK